MFDLVPHNSDTVLFSYVFFFIIYNIFIVVLKAMTNGRLVSVRHRAMVTSYDTRMSTVFFGGPPLHAWISPIPEMITTQRPRRYRSFTWSEFKKMMYSLRLGHNRLELFRFKAEEEA